MKIGQRVSVVETGSPRDLLSSESWAFYGELAESVGANYGKVTESINFSVSPFKQNIRLGQLELCFNGIVLVKICHTNETEYGVGVFWTVDKPGDNPSWTQCGIICSLSDKECKRYLREVLGDIR